MPFSKFPVSVLVMCIDYRFWPHALPIFQKKYGVFDLNYKLAADYELLARLLEYHRIRTAYIPDVLIKMRLGGATNKSLENIVKGNLEIFRACKKNNIKISHSFFLMNKLVDRTHQICQRWSGKSGQVCKR